MARDIPLKYCAVMWGNVNLFHGFYQCEIKFNSDFSVTVLNSFEYFNIWVCLGKAVYNEKEENDSVITRIYLWRDKFDEVGRHHQMDGTRHEKSFPCYSILIS